MAQETEPVASSAPLESPSSPKRRNRKKGRRGSTAAGEDEEDMDLATDLVSLPSPVASVGATDVFATVETAMNDLALTTDKEEQPKEDGLLKLPMHPSSGRLPLTPPPTPEPFLVHSPDKEQSRVAPLVQPATDVQLLPTVEEVKDEVVEEHFEEQEAAMAEVEVAPVEVQTVVDAPVGVAQETEQAVVEPEAATLSSSLADMNLSNRTPNTNAEVEAEAPLLAEGVHKQQGAPVADDHVEMSPTDGKVNSISALSSESIEHTPAPCAEAAVSETTMTPSMEIEAASTEMQVAPPLELPLPTEQVPTEPTMTSEPSPAETSLVPVMEAPLTAPTPAETPATIEPVPSDTPVEAEQATQQKDNRPLPQPARRNKRKGDSPEQKPHTTSAATSRIFHKTQSKATSSAKTDEAAKSTSAASKDDPESQTQSRPAKRKGDASDANPPPAPLSAAAKDIRPKRLVARSSSGSTLSKARTDTEQNAKSAVASHPANELKKDSMMNPTASSLARATAAEARKALLKGTAAKKTPARKPTRSKILAKSAARGPSAPSEQDKSITALPAPAAVEEEEDSLRNVKRRLNATDANAASTRLYDDAKEGKARKDARRAELQETYTFAPQVNNSKRRSPPGDTEESSQDHFTRLHAQAKELLEKKRELQQQHERDGCTFAPTISARAKRLAQPSSGPRYENLYKHAQEMKQKREEKLMEKAKTTEEQCPFKPKITASKSPVKTKPLYDSEREKQKRLALEQKKIEAEMSECTFKPKVSTKRLKGKTEEPSDAPTGAATDANPYNRLYQASIERAERLQKMRQERDEEEKAQAPFQPKITARSRMLKAKTKSKEPFHKRLYNKDYMKKVDAEREQRRLEEEQQFTFKPEINEPPEEIKAKVNERASPRKSIFERLYDEKDKMKEKIEISEELFLQKEMAECTFRPQIKVDGTQSSGESVPPVWERLLSYDKAQVIEEREKLREQLEMQECTFKPEVKSPDALLMKRSPSFNVFDRLTGSGANSPLDPTRASFITRRPSSSPGRQSPDSKGVSIGRIIKLTKFPMPTARKMPSRTYSISQPSSVNKQAMKRSTSFSGPKSAASSPTMSTAEVLSKLMGGTSLAESAIAATEDPNSITENYQTWSAALDAKLRQL